jgi:hypothetical protein
MTVVRPGTNKVGNFYFWRQDNKVFVQIVPVSDYFLLSANLDTIVQGGIQCKAFLSDRNHESISGRLYVSIVDRLGTGSGCDINSRFKYIYVSDSYSVDIPGKEEPFPPCTDPSSGGGGGGGGCFIRSVN